MDEALKRLTDLRCVPLSLRERVVDGVLLAALEGTEEKPFAAKDRMMIAKLLSFIVPAGVVTREMLEKGVIDVMMLFEDLKADYPRADKELAELVDMGLLMGTLKDAAFDGPPAHDVRARADHGYVPIGVIAAPVAAHVFGLSQASLRLAGALLPARVDEPYHDAAEGAPEAAGAAQLRVAAPEPDDAPPSRDSADFTPQPDSPAVEDVFGAKKKKPAREAVQEDE